MDHLPKAHRDARSLIFHVVPDASGFTSDYEPRSNPCKCPRARMVTYDPADCTGYPAETPASKRVHVSIR